MAFFEDPYAVLGVMSTASDEEIRVAYRALAFRHHPDRNPENVAKADARLKQVNEAFEQLKDPAVRAATDRLMVRQEFARCAEEWRRTGPQPRSTTTPSLPRSRTPLTEIAIKATEGHPFAERAFWTVLGAWADVEFSKRI